MFTSTTTMKRMVQSFLKKSNVSIGSCGMSSPQDNSIPPLLAKQPENYTRKLWWKIEESWIVEKKIGRAHV